MTGNFVKVSKKNIHPILVERLVKFYFNSAIIAISVKRRVLHRKIVLAQKSSVKRNRNWRGVAIGYYIPSQSHYSSHTY